MAALSDYAENKLLDHMLGKGAFSMPAAVYAALFTASTGLETNAPSAEVSTSGTAYARVAITFGSSASGANSNTAAITFAKATAPWETVTHIAIMDAATAGNVLAWSSLSASQDVLTNNIFEVAIGDLDISLD